MSYQAAAQPECSKASAGLALLIEPRERDLGGIVVRRVLPASQRRMVGPFIFFDHFGPDNLAGGEGLQIRPHPHIGLATVSYLFDGEIVHRDSLGCVETITPGAINLMTAGKGITHSERSPADLARVPVIHGIQSWIALPADSEESAPSFRNFSEHTLPVIAEDGVQLRVLMGSFNGHSSPVETPSPALYMDCQLEEGATLSLQRVERSEYPELAVYLVSGSAVVGSTAVRQHTMAVIGSGSDAVIRAASSSRIMLIGGAPVGERHIWWNFVSSSKERIEKARSDWQAGRFDSVPGESEFIPLPE